MLNHAAVGDHAGVARLDINEAHIADHRVGIDGKSSWAGRTGTRSEVVPLLTLDDYFENTLAREPVSFIKIDVQGHELKVLKGARKLLSANPAAAIALEYDPVRLREVGDSPESLLAYLSTQGMKLYECSGELRPITSPMQLDQLTSSKDYCDLLCSRRTL